MKHTLMRNYKVSVWVQEYVEVEADTLKEAIEKVADCKGQTTNTKLLYETMEASKRGGKSPTIEIMDQHGNLLWNDMEREVM